MRKILIILSVCFLMLSCNKKDNTYRAELRVVTLSGIPIQNASIKLFVPNPTATEFYTITDDDGKAYFEIKAKAFYDVKTWKGTYRGCGFVEFKKGELVTKDIIIRTWGDPLNTCFN